MLDKISRDGFDVPNELRKLGGFQIIWDLQPQKGPPKYMVTIKAKLDGCAEFESSQLEGFVIHPVSGSSIRQSICSCLCMEY
jgi:hypothetical protein